MAENTMKALVRTALSPGSVVLAERPIPEISEDEVLIKIAAVGVCGTDLHIYNGNLDTATDIVIGHELSGIIEKTGKNVKHLHKGDRVVSRLNVGSCGICKACLSGNPQMCEKRTCPGHKADGAFAQYMKIEAIHVIPFSENISFEEACFTEPMACVAHGLLERAGVRPEETVVIYGPGSIGLIAMQMAKMYGALNVVMVGTQKSAGLRLLLAEKLGADKVMVAGTDDVPEYISQITKGEGADLVVDCSGSASAVNEGIHILRRQGRMSVIGLPSKGSMTVDWLLAAQKSLDIVFSYSSSPASWNMCLSMLERHAIDVKSLINRTGGLEDFKAIANEAKAGKIIKAVIKP